MDIVMSRYFPSMPGANQFLHSLRSIITPVYCECKENTYVCEIRWIQPYL